ncbi:hypothetical protein LINPERHAP1_LOCUS22305 [Linum perenne]
MIKCTRLRGALLRLNIGIHGIGFWNYLNWTWTSKKAVVGVFPQIFKRYYLSSYFLPLIVFLFVFFICIG